MSADGAHVITSVDISDSGLTATRGAICWQQVRAGSVQRRSATVTQMLLATRTVRLRSKESVCENRSGGFCFRHISPFHRRLVVYRRRRRRHYRHFFHHQQPLRHCQRCSDRLL